MKNLIKVQIVILGVAIGFSNLAVASSAVEVPKILKKIVDATIKSSKASEVSMVTGKFKLTEAQIKEFSGFVEILPFAKGETQFAFLKLGADTKSKVVFVREPGADTFTSVQLQMSDVHLPVNDKSDGMKLSPRFIENTPLIKDYQLRGDKMVTLLKEEKKEIYEFTTGDVHSVVTTHFWRADGSFDEVRVVRYDHMKREREKFSLQSVNGKNPLLAIDVVDDEALGVSKNITLVEGDKVINVGYSAKEKSARVLIQSKSGKIEEKKIALTRNPVDKPNEKLIPASQVK
jgi:hypothetical protein